MVKPKHPKSFLHGDAPSLHTQRWPGIFNSFHEWDAPGVNHNHWGVRCPLCQTQLENILGNQMPLVSYYLNNLDQNGMPLVIGGWERDVDWGCTSGWSCLRILFRGIKPYVVQVKDFTRVFSLFFCQGCPFRFSSLAFFFLFLFLFFILALTFAWIALSGFQSSGLLSRVVSLCMIKV